MEAAFIPAGEMNSNDCQSIRRTSIEILRICSRLPGDRSKRPAADANRILTEVATRKDLNKWTLYSKNLPSDMYNLVNWIFNTKTETLFHMHFLSPLQHVLRRPNHIFLQKTRKVERRTFLGITVHVEILTESAK